MNSPAHTRGQTLILLAAWLFFGGTAASALLVYDRSAAELKKVVKESIADPGRREAFLIDIDQWQVGQEYLDQRVSAHREELVKTLRRQDARRSELEPTLSALDAALAEMDRNFLDLRFRLRDRVTRSEWADIVARPGR